MPYSMLNICNVCLIDFLVFMVYSCFDVFHYFYNSHVLRFNSLDVGEHPNETNLHCAQFYSDLLRITFKGESGPKRGPYENAAMFANKFEELASDLKLPLYLRDVGIKEEDIELLTINAMKQTRLLPNNAREVKEEDARKMYEAAL